MTRIDELIARLAGRQHGVVSRPQLVALGMGRRAIEHRLACGRLHIVHRGVYSVGHRLLTREGRWMAATLAGGIGAVLSHRSAAELWGLVPVTATAAPVEVWVPGARRCRKGLRYRGGRLPADEITTSQGIPVTTVPRTLIDLAGLLERHRLERAIDQAEVLRLRDRLSLVDMVRRYPRRRGAGTVRRILAAEQRAAAITRSDLELDFLPLLDAAGLPRPQINAGVRAAGRWFEVDCVWSGARLAAELDGRATHLTPAAFEADRRRDRALQVAGWRVIRITWRQVTDDPSALMSDLRTLLADHRVTV